MSGDLTRFLELVRRELGADTAVLKKPEEAKESGELRLPLRPGEDIAVRFTTEPADIDARRRRLEILIAAFTDGLEAASHNEPRASVARSLHEELRVLMARANAIDAVVIDANSPVIWGVVRSTLREEEDGGIVIPIARQDQSRRALIGNHDDDEEGPEEEKEAEEEDDDDPTLLVARAIKEVRALPAVARLHKGAHLSYLHGEKEFGYVARSFAAIYILVLVFERTIDEIRAERAIRESLPMIERLVLALPPRDPQPHAGVVAIRRRRPRRA